MSLSYIQDIHFINSLMQSKEELHDLYRQGVLANDQLWHQFKLENTINNLGQEINSPLKKRMSQLSRGIYQVLDEGGGLHIDPADEIYLFTSFAEIDTTHQIMKKITLDHDQLVSPTLFHNSVHNTPLGYYTIIKKIHNYCCTISDGLDTPLSFIRYIEKRVQIEQPFIIACGEEASDFYALDRINCREFKPVFFSYKIRPGQAKGFIHKGCFNGLEELTRTIAREKYDTLIGCAQSFAELKKITPCNLISDYPLVNQLPCAIIFRIALPFYLDIKGKSLVIEKSGPNYYCFEVAL